MSKYIPNPKMRGSGLVACIPQTGTCPNRCEDCLFQSGRSYLEPLEENLPNMPSIEEVGFRVVRVNDGNDSNADPEQVIEATRMYPLKFYNTAIPSDLENFDAPVVVTVNPHRMTDLCFYRISPISKNLMFVRVRVNTWNLKRVDEAVEYYSSREVPVGLTFMAYFTGVIPKGNEENYVYRKRTLNSYWAITTKAWEKVMERYRYNKWVYSCGKIEGERGTTACARCGNCIREFFVTKERIRDSGKEIAGDC